MAKNFTLLAGESLPALPAASLLLFELKLLK